MTPARLRHARELPEEIRAEYMPSYRHRHTIANALDEIDYLIARETAEADDDFEGVPV